MKKRLPHDPEHMNDDRAAWARKAVIAFGIACKTDPEDTLADLLCDLMHYADRNSEDFHNELRRARQNYDAETSKERQS